jgi:hypothetical protein
MRATVIGELRRFAVLLIIPVAMLAIALVASAVLPVV